MLASVVPQAMEAVGAAVVVAAAGAAVLAVVWRCLRFCAGGRRRSERIVAQATVGAQPALRPVIACSMAAIVAGPARPSTSRPCLSWKASTAAAVRRPG